jgi:hypothetical protein
MQLQSRIAEGLGADAGLVGLHRYDLPLGVDMLYRTRNKRRSIPSAKKVSAARWR